MLSLKSAASTAQPSLTMLLASPKARVPAGQHHGQSSQQADGLSDVKFTLNSSLVILMKHLQHLHPATPVLGHALCLVPPALAPHHQEY